MFYSLRKRVAGKKTPTSMFRSLRLRLLQPLLLLSLLAAVAGSVGIYLITGSQLRQELQLRGQMLSGAIVIAAETNSALGDLQRIVLAMASERNVESISLVDFDYQPIFYGDTFTPNSQPGVREELDRLAQQALQQDASVGAIDIHNKNVYHVLTPVYISALHQNNVLRPKPALLIINLITTDSERKARNTTILLTLLFSGLGIVALVMIYFLMNHLVLKPSLKIVEVMQTQNIGMLASTGFQPTDEMGLIGQTFDVLTETLEARERALELALHQAQDASVAKSQFLANMSHELRTPMNAILGMLALLRKTGLNPRQSDYAIKTEGAARSLLSLLNDILDISKAEAGKMELDPTPFCLDHLTRNLSVILATNLTDKPVEFLFNIAEDLPRYFLGDAMRLQQVLINLGGNAIKFTERGNVTLSITQQGQSDEKLKLHFRVHDTGIGIAPENQAKIFSGFTQAEASTTRRFGGTGLGLAISQRLVELMGGKLELESLLGSGSCFFFTIELPLLSDEAITALKTSHEQSDPSAGQLRLYPMNLLLVEDNLNNQQIALELLEGEGAKVHIANHGQEAIEILQANSRKTNGVLFNAVLMDLQMPVMDGLTAARAIRHELGLLDLPIIAMTANAMSTDRDACIAAGMNDHVGKPFDLNHLVQVLRQHTGWKSQDLTPAFEANKPIELETCVPVSPHLTSSSAEEFALENGIDLIGAIKRLGGNKKLYIKMLPKFLANMEGLSENLLALLAQEDLTGLARELHSLKGIAATMGFTVVADEASHGEKFIQRVNTSAEVAPMLEHLCQNIAKTISPAQSLLLSLQADPAS